MLLNLFLYIVSFAFIWLGSGLILSSVTKFSRKLKLSPFAFSFVFLGLLTSTPEFSVGLQAVADHNAPIFVGNLLGGIIVLFLVVIPLLAVFGNGVNLKNDLDHKTLLATLGVILAPAIFILDKRVSNVEGVLLIVLYLILLYMIERKNGIFDHKNERLQDLKAYSYKDLFKILIGIGVVFAASNVIVDKTMYFSELFKIPAFYIGLIVIALGTDLPELSLALRSVVSGKKEIAMGDYIGAAAVSTFMFGLFTLLHNGEVLTVSNFMVTFMFMVFALGCFYFYSTVKGTMSRTNGAMLLGVYAVFVVFEVMRF